jgi:hypothetical protein
VAWHPKRLRMIADSCQLVSMWRFLYSDGIRCTSLECRCGLLVILILIRALFA